MTVDAECKIHLEDDSRVRTTCGHWFETKEAEEYHVGPESEGVFKAVLYRTKNGTWVLCLAENEDGEGKIIDEAEAEKWLGGFPAELEV